MRNRNYFWRGVYFTVTPNPSLGFGVAWKQYEGLWVAFWRTRFYLKSTRRRLWSWK